MTVGPKLGAWASTKTLRTATPGWNEAATNAGGSAWGEVRSMRGCRVRSTSAATYQGQDDRRDDQGNDHQDRDHHYLRDQHQMRRGAARAQQPDPVDRDLHRRIAKVLRQVIAERCDLPVRKFAGEARHVHART